MQATQTTLTRLLSERPSIHPTRDGRDRCIGLNPDVLSHLYHQLSPNLQTLETGCGLSTLVFALADCRHQAIAPNKVHIQETQKTAADHGISLEKISFIQARSEDTLPHLGNPENLDVVLIDGGHAFPIPFIDWFYTRQRLAVGGLLVLDDVHLKTVNILYTFLKKQPAWTLTNIIHKTAFFRKDSSMIEDNVWDYWQKQPFNNDWRSRINRYLWRLRQPFYRS